MQLVETTGDFMLIDPYFGDPIHADRPTVVRSTSFIDTRVSQGQLKMLAADLPAEANDKDFAEYWAEQPEAAVDAYLSSFSEPEKKQEPAKKTSRAKKTED